MIKAPFSVLVGTSDTVLRPARPRRAGLIVNSPAPTDTPVISDGTLTSAASTATTGVKSSYTVPAGVQAVLTGAGTVETTTTGVVSSLQLVRGATTYNLGTVTTSGFLAITVPLQAGDVVQWNVTTAIATAVNDYWIAVSRERVPVQVAIVFGGQAAALGNGITLWPGTLPLQLSCDHWGCIDEEVHAIATPAAVTLAGYEFLHP